MVRGEALSLIAGQKKKCRAEIDKVEVDLLDLKREVSSGDDPGGLHCLRLLRDKYRSLARDMAKTQHADTQSRIYEHSDKAGKLIAWLEKGEWTRRLVPSC